MIRPLLQMSGDEARGLLFGLVESDKIQLRKYPDLPSMRQLIADGKVKYDAYDPKEHWQTYKELCDNVTKNGVAYGDCEDLATAVAAEDQVRHGVNSQPYAYQPREGLFHVVTAVPTGSVPRGRPAGRGPEVVSGSRSGRGSIPASFGGWPIAMGATEIPGYVLQDPSRAAGMGTGFSGYAPAEESGMSRYGAHGSDGKGLGGALRQLGSVKELGSGIKEGLGLKAGWERQLGAQIPGRLGVKSPIEPSEDAAVKSLRKGMDAEHEGASRKSNHEDDDADLEEDDEDFGGLGDAVCAEMFGRAHGGGQHFRDEFGAGGQYSDLDRSVILEEEEFAGVSTLRRSDLFGGLRRTDLFGGFKVEDADDEDEDDLDDLDDEDDDLLDEDDAPQSRRDRRTLEARRRLGDQQVDDMSRAAQGHISDKRLQRRADRHEDSRLARKAHRSLPGDSAALTFPAFGGAQALRRQDLFGGGLFSRTEDDDLDDLLDEE